MYAIKLDWMAAYKKFASVAEVWMRQYHYFMATGKNKLLHLKKPLSRNFLLN